MKYSHTRLSLSILASSMAFATLSVEAVESGFELEEVVVTAQKRAQDLQDVPIAVTAMDATALRQAGIEDVKGIAQRTPGFSMGTFMAAQPQLFIRGIGSNGDSAGGGEQSVAMFIDGVYINRSAGGSMELFDLASVEVLRGPQGTLWGKNAIGGAVNMRSKRPSEEFDASFEVGMGNLGLQTYRGLVSGGLTEQLAGKVTFSRKERDDWIDSAADDSVHTGGLDSDSIRAQLLFIPSETVEVQLSADYGSDDRSGISINPQIGAAENGAVNQFASFAPEIDFHDTMLEDAGFQSVEGKGVSLAIDWDISDTVTLSSISAYRETDTAFANNNTGTGLSTFSVFELFNFAAETSEMLSQELRLSGDTDAVHWQTGVYFNNEQTSRAEGGDFLIGPGGPLLGIPAFLEGVTLTDLADQRNETDSVAVFGQFTYSVSEVLDVTLGARYSKEEKDFANTGTRGIGLFVVEDYDVTAQESWSKPTYKLTANYQLAEDAMIYVSAATGFKSGGFDGVASTSLAASTAFNEEEALNLELGLKSMLLDNRLRFNAAIFSTAYDNLQVLGSIEDGVCTICPLVTLNAGEAESAGVEVEATFLATQNLQFSFNYAYLDTEYTTLNTEGLKEFEGNSLRNAPENAYNIAALYEKDLDNGGAFTARAEWIHKDIAYQSIQNREAGAIPEYDLGNLRLSYTSADEQWEVSGWVNNIADEEYLAHNYVQPGFGVLATAGMPRTYGLTLTWSSQ